MKKLFIFILCFTILVSSLCVSSFASFTNSFETDAPIVYVVSSDNNSSVIYDKGSEERCDPGELVKVVTGILAIENCDNLGDIVTASETAIRTIEKYRSATTAGILVGEVMTVEELLHCLLVYNAGDAAEVLAEYVAGSRAAFVDMMNEFASELGLENTRFTNPVGINEENQYTTARDMAVIFNYCMNNSAFSQIISTFLYEMPATNKYSQTRYLKTTNGLINTGIYDYYFKYVKGGKSGYTKDLKCNVVSLASKDGYNYICVVMNADNKDYDSDSVSENMSFVTSKKLYEWVFDNIKLKEVANTSTYVCEVRVRLSDDFDYVSLVPAENVNALVPSGVNAESVFIEPIAEYTSEEYDAPIKKGDKLGRASIKYAGETIAEVDLVADFDVKRSTIKYIGDLIIKTVTKPLFIIIFAVIVIVIVPLCLISYRNKQIKRKKQRRKAYEINNKRG